MKSEIVNGLDALAVAMFTDIGRQTDKNGDLVKAEIYYKRAIKTAEAIYGCWHGETGLVLSRLAAFYRRHGRHEDAVALEQRIGEITALYIADQIL